MGDTRGMRACIAAFLASAALGSNAVQTRYLDFGDTGQAKLLTADAAGNLFAVGLVTEASGLGQIRVIKTDASGNVLGSIDFGANASDSAAGAAVDAQGNLVIIGSTSSANFPLVNALALNPPPRVPAAFVVKVDAQLETILLSTLLGGTTGTFASGNAVAVDSKGNIYAAGATDEMNFPVTANAFQASIPIFGVGNNRFATITEISPSGQIVFSTFYAGTKSICQPPLCFGHGTAVPSAIAVDSSGNVIVAGNTTQSDLPTTAGAYAQQCSCNQAGFVAKFAPGGSKLVWASLIPPQDNNSMALSSMALQANGIALGGVSTQASTRPLGLVARLDPTGSKLLSSTNVGAFVPTIVTPQPIAIDSQGLIWTTGPIYVEALSSEGTTVSSSFTTPAGASGQAIVTTANGPVSLGPTGSLLIGGNTEAPSLLGVANSAGSSVSGIVAPAELVSLYGAGIGPATALSGQIRTLDPEIRT